MGRGPGPQDSTNLPFVPFDHQIRTADGTLVPNAGTPAFITANVGALPIDVGTTNLNPTQFAAGASNAKKFYAPQNNDIFNPDIQPGGPLRTAQLSAGLTSFGIMVVNDLLAPTTFVVQGGGAGSPTSFTFTTSEFFTDQTGDHPPENLVINGVQYAGWKYVGKDATAQTITVSNFQQPDDSITIGTDGVATDVALRTFYLWIEGTGNTNTDQLKIDTTQPDPTVLPNMRLSLESDVVSADENGAGGSDPTTINSGVPINVSQFKTNPLTSSGLLPELGTDNVTTLLGDTPLFFEISTDADRSFGFGAPVAEYSGNLLDSLSANINFENFSRSIFTTFENRDLDVNTGVVTNTYLICQTGTSGPSGPSVPSNLLVNGQPVAGYVTLIIQTIGSTVVISTGIFVLGRQSGLTKNFLQITEVNQFVQADGDVTPVDITVSTEFAGGVDGGGVGRGAVVGYTIESTT